MANKNNELMEIVAQLKINNELLYHIAAGHGFLSKEDNKRLRRLIPEIADQDCRKCQLIYSKMSKTPQCQNCKLIPKSLLF